MSLGSRSCFWRSAILILRLLDLRNRVLASGVSEWTYTGDHGEDHWESTYPECGNHQQSPIDFHTGIFEYDPTLEPIQLLGYNLSAAENFSLINDGHAVKMALPPTMQMICASHRYTAVQLHLHWGSETETLGSEHTISGRHYPSELHIVHYNSEKYGDISTAQDKADGLAVLGILIEIGSFNAAYEQIFSHLTEIQFKGKEIKMPGFNINDLLPRELDEYFRYNGSLTTPPCYPSVLWTVFRKPVQISREQLSELQKDLYFSRMDEANQTEMVNNYRHVQKLWEREVFISFYEDTLNAEHKLAFGVIVTIALGCLLCVMVASALTVFFLRKRCKQQRQTRQSPQRGAQRTQQNKPHRSTTALPDERLCCSSDAA
ncbi:carbonic anhydrase 12 isoform X1 [Chiloscyllium plagiosum]|uniref:carbonic anhydrase 12 isoform X1 n=1 Tax=Chiloscyllium plagiosum TaxID=36176 RepID=UPI001CB82C64|nr:carbonic anhydrase 12 isoform X1 [Chiloscyllium plagiosum]XP_043536074.1 carbonic anhydrase 12 isoform X1 [Chiloscyllium plagiosum]